MRNTRFAVALVVGLVALTLTTCGDNASDVADAVSTPSSQTTEDASSAPVASEPLPIEVNVAQADAGTVRSITVGGMGSVYTEPDRCVIDLGVTVRRPTVVEASSAAGAAAQAMTEALVDAGAEMKHIQTSDFSVGTYSRNWPDIEGYETHIGYRVTLPDVDQVGQVLAGAIAAGGDDVRAWGIRFEADPTGLMEGARQEAWADVAARAEALAELAGEPLGEVLDAHEKVLVSTTHGMFEGGEGDTAAFTVPASPGQSGVIVLLTVTFAIGE